MTDADETREGRGRGERPARRTRRDDDKPVLPGVTRDEQSVGWGEDSDERSDEWYRRERPPHHE